MGQIQVSDQPMHPPLVRRAALGQLLCPPQAVHGEAGCGTAQAVPSHHTLVVWWCRYRINTLPPRATLISCFLHMRNPLFSLERGPRYPRESSYLDRGRVWGWG